MHVRNPLNRLAKNFIFTEKFFELPARKKDIDDLVAMIAFPMPDSPEQLSAFFASADGVMFRNGLTGLFTQMGRWAQKYFATAEAVDHYISIIKEKFIDYDGSDPGLNTTYFPTYKQAVPYLIGVLQLLDHTAIPFDVKKKQVSEIFHGMLKCVPGLYTRVYDAYTEMVSYICVQEDFMAYRTEVAKTVAINLMRHLQYTPLSVSPGDEIHYANRVLTEFSTDLCILVNEDTLSRVHPSKLKILIEWFPSAYIKALSLEGLLLHLASKLQIDDAFNKAAKAMKEGNMPAFNDVFTDLNAVFNRFGQGNLDVDRLFIMSDDCASLTAISIQAEAYVYASIIDRLLVSGYVHPDCCLSHEFVGRGGEKSTVTYLPFKSLKYAYVKSTRGLVPFLDYYVSMTVAGVNHEKIDELIACKSDDYDNEIAVYLTQYLRQAIAEDESVSAACVALIAALFRLTKDDFDSTLAELPECFVPYYIHHLINAEFPRGIYRGVANEVMELYRCVGYTNGLILIKALLGFQENLGVAINEQGETLFHLACRYGSGNIVTFLLHAIDGLAPRTVNGVTPLMLACQHGNARAVKALLDIRSELVFDTDHWGLSAIHYATINGDTDIVRLLIHSQADVSAESKGKITPLHIACNNQNLSLTALLISSGANINAVHDDGTSVLDVACLTGNYAIIMLLLNAGVALNASSNHFDELVDILCDQYPGHLSRKILVEAVHDYLRRSDEKVQSGRYQVADASSPDRHNHCLFSYKMGTRYAKSRVAEMLLYKLNTHGDDRDHFWQSDNEKLMYERACRHSKQLKRLIEIYDKLSLGGYLALTKKQKLTY